MGIYENPDIMESRLSTIVTSTGQGGPPNLNPDNPNPGHHYWVGVPCDYSTYFSGSGSLPIHTTWPGRPVMIVIGVATRFRVSALGLRF